MLGGFLNAGGWNAESRRDQRLFMISKHLYAGRHLAQLIGRALRVAASDHDPGIRLLPQNFAHELAAGTVRVRGHTAGVDDINIRAGVHGNDVKAAEPKLPAQLFRLILIHLAAERMECDGAVQARSSIFMRRGGGSD